MGTTADKLQKILTTKESIRQAIISKGVSVDTNAPFSSYASKIAEIQGVISEAVFNSIESLKDGWKYKLISSVYNKDYTSTEEAQISYNDSTWDNVTIPHDWSIYNEFNSNSSSGYDGGFLDGGDSWYRKKLTNLTDDTKEVYIYFDGIYKNADVYINGVKVGDNKWYNPFYFNITENLNFDGNDTLAVFVSNPQPSSRWYSGSGIIRNVYLLTGSPSAFGISNIVVTSDNLENEINTGLVNTNIKSNIINNTASSVNVILKYSISFNGEEINNLATVLTLNSGNNEIINTIEIPNPVLWDEYKGNLYKLKLEVISNSDVICTKEVLYGYRYFEFTKDNGFFLNGRNLKLRGVCMHHDLGCLGAEVNISAIERQIKILKEMGCNAIRLTHNPSSSEFLNVCAKEGIMLVEEAFDCWEAGKKQYDFQLQFNSHAESSLKYMIKRGINNPAIIMWSIGNEIYGPTVETATRLIQWVKEVDTTRPVTLGCNEPASDVFLQIFDLLDVVGINYGNDSEYTTLKSSKPNIKLYGSETTSALSSRGEYEYDETNMLMPSFDNRKVGWGDFAAVALKRHIYDFDYLAGMFVWTGFDYIGESTPFRVYPARSSYFGIVDLAGFPKDIYYMYQSRWTDKPMIHILPHWTYETGVGKKTIWLYSNCYKVELFLNGVSKGSILQSNIGDKYQFNYYVDYEEGTLVANGYDENNNLIAQDVMCTTYGAKKIELLSDKSIVNNKSDDLIFVECNILDSNGNICPTASNEITFTCVNGTIVATDNGKPTDVTSSLRSNVRSAYNGKALCVVRPDRSTSDVIITATSTDLTSATINVKQGNFTALTTKVNKFIDATNPPVIGQEVEIEGITFNENNIEVTLNSPYTLKYSFSPENTTQKSLLWSVSPSDIAIIDDGVITGSSEGSCVVTVTSAVNDSITAQCNITFVDRAISVTGVSLDKETATVKKGGNVDLTATVIPDNATNQTVTWSANNANVSLTPNSNFVTVSGDVEGESIVTATTSDGNYTASCTVTVQSNQTVIEGYTAIRENYTCDGTSFIDTVAFDSSSQTIFADITIDNSVTSQNILSIGSNIASWKAGGKTQIHTYNTAATILQVNAVRTNNNKNEITNSGRVKIALNTNGLYVNGSKLTNSNISIESIGLLAGDDGNIEIGSAEGTVRSISTYNSIGLCNSVLSESDLIQITTI